MSNPNTFDEASAATEEMFENEQLTLGDVLPENETASNESTDTSETSSAGETPAETTPAEAENEPAQQKETETVPSAIEQAAQTAEVAAQVASEKDDQLKSAMAEIEKLRRQNEHLQGMVDEMSEQNAEKVIEEALEPPALDINGLAFADEETQKAAMAKYADEMSAYNRKQIMKEMSPVLEYAKKGMHEAQTKEVVAALSQIPELSGIQGMLPQLDRIIAGNKWLQSEDMPLDEKYINAYAMARGIDSINNPPAQSESEKEPTPEELLALYNNNPAFQELVEKQRLDAIKQNQQVPSFSASSGAVNAALGIKEKPQTLEEASERTRKMFGGM